MSNRKKFYGSRRPKRNRRSKPNPNVDMDAWNTVRKEAPRLNYDPDKMGRRYSEIKRQKERKNFFVNTPSIKSPSQKRRPRKTTPMRKRFVPKQIVLDDLREYRSSKIISSVSNAFATFVVKATAKPLSNSQKNVLRSIIALATSETLGGALKKELETIDKIKTFVKVGQTIYKIVLWYDENAQEYRTDTRHIKKVKGFSLQYKHFLRTHPILKEIYSNQSCLSLEEIQSGQKCSVKEHLDRMYCISTNDSIDTPNSCPYYFYCHN